MVFAINTYSPKVMSALATPVGSSNVQRLCATWSDKSCHYVYPDDLFSPSQYQRDRGMTQYFADLPGLEHALQENSGTYIDVGAGHGIAAEEIAQRKPELQVLAISKTNLRAARTAPRNMSYLVADAKTAFLANEFISNVTADLYGAFTFDVVNQFDLFDLYMRRLSPMGKAFVRFDGDHIGVVNQSGMLMFFSEWLTSLQLPNISADEGPNPTGPTFTVSVVTLQKMPMGFALPKPRLVGIRQFGDDVVPFVVYEAND